jgi:hypothetical protein
MLSMLYISILRAFSYRHGLLVEGLATARRDRAALAVSEPAWRGSTRDRRDPFYRQRALHSLPIPLYIVTTICPCPPGTNASADATAPWRHARDLAAKGGAP